jgi:NADPH:quinone reductase-like Zn-dependent oxidoreductase
MPPFRFVQVHKYSPDFRAATRIATRAELPTPAAGHVVVKNHFLGVNATDINITNGSRGGNAPLPITCGLDGGELS